jgi:hypothetical protein
MRRPRSACTGKGGKCRFKANGTTFFAGDACIDEPTEKPSMRTVRRKGIRYSCSHNRGLETDNE